MTRRLSWVVALALLFTLADVQAAWAGCFTDMKRCFLIVSTQDSFWDRFFGALDCELDFVDCARRKLVGV